MGELNNMKAIFFDFDGTLTHKSPNIWREVWHKCGYNTGKDSYYRQLFNDFLLGKITHQEWCDKCLDKYVEAGFNRGDLNDIVSNIELIDGVEETFKFLKEKGYKIYIISGNIIDAIEVALGNLTKYIDDIKANDFVFDEFDKLCYIKGTKYDFEGKARYIEECCQKYNIKASDMIFVGNGDNDEWVYRSGCKTICINPENVDPTDKSKWHKYKDNVDNLKDILQMID